MKELDLLKKDWKKTENSFEQISETEIYKMIHKKSSSIVKWIFIISIIEFVVLNAIGFLLPDDTIHQLGWLENLIQVLNFLSYGLALFFMFLFYKNYKTISTTSTTKKLMESIIKTRKTVQYYIYSILATGLLAGIFVGFYLIRKAFIENNQSVMITFFESLVLFIFIAIILGLVWLFYRIIYGFLLKRLQKNYEELSKIDL